MGPLITGEHRDKVAGYVDGAAADGATVVVDGRDGAPDGRLLPQAVAARQRQARHGGYDDEIFGPVLGVTRISGYAEGLQLINDNPYGNGTAIFTRDGGAARQFEFDVQVGMVGVNVPIPVPVSYYSFGGWKASLFGDTHMYGPEGVNFFTRTKVVTSRWPDPSHQHRRPRLPAEQVTLDFGVVLQTTPPSAARHRSGQARRGVRVRRTSGRSTRTSCGRSRTSSTARSWPRRATSSSGRWSPTRRRATGP